MALVGVAAVLAVAAFPFWTGKVYSADEGASAIPQYWRDAAHWVDDAPGDGRVLVLPSTSYGAYTWGRTGDDILEGLITRPSVSRGLLSTWEGTKEAANLTAALDDYLNGGHYQAGVIGPIARRLGIRYVMVRNDLDWQTTHRARPDALAPLRADPDLVPVKSFGRPGQQVELGTPADPSEGRLPPVEIFEVKDFDGVARAETAPPLLVAGDGDAWPGLAAVGLLTGTGPVRYTGDASSAELQRLLTHGSPIVITDSNRRRVKQIPLFDTIARSSYTLAAGQELDRPTQDLFHSAPTETVATFPDAQRISASAYGRPPIPQAYYRPANVFDGDPTTSWRVHPSVLRDESEKPTLRVRFKEPQRLTRVTVVPAQAPATAARPDPYRPGRATLHFSDGSRVPIDLAHGTATATFTPRSTSSLAIRIDSVVGTDPAPFGIAEVSVGDLDLHERIQVPDDVFTRAARSPKLRAGLATAPIVYSFRRLPPLDGREVETTLRRRFRTVDTRTYSLVGTTDAPTVLSGQCTDVGLAVDGLAVPVRASDAAQRGAFMACAPVALDGGWHTLDTTRASGIRSAVLASGADGNALTASLAPAPRGTAARATTTARDRNSFDVQVTTPGAATVIGGESYDPGWSATIDGHDAGAPTAFDTQAAWTVPRAGAYHLDAHQDAQTIYEVALVVTLLGLVACGVLVVRGRLR